MNDSPAPLHRRAVLGGLTGVTAAGLSGCLGRIQSAIDRDPPRQVSVGIKTVPADDDREAVRIARHLAENLETAGLAVTVEPTTEDKLLREVLINKNFDIYVGQHPGQDDPDFLRAFLHSKFSEEPGWQNPFSYSNITVDELLDLQKEAGDDRLEVLAELQRYIVQDFPFITILFPEELRVVRTDRYTGWADSPLTDSLGYLGLSPVGGGAGTDDVQPGDGDTDRDGTLRVGLIDRRSTRNLNPLGVEFRDHGTITGLLYDPLAYRLGDDYVPWLAKEWRWVSPSHARYPTLELSLREQQQWHDGEPITADDVVFTYRFLRDTTMEDEDPVVPTPRFRGRSSLVDSADVVGETTVRVQFDASSREVAQRVLTVPILPKHIWEEQATLTEVAGIELQSQTTEALIWENTEPVGSGPFQFAESSVDEHVTLERFDEHFLQRESLSDPTSQFARAPHFARLEFLVYPSEQMLVEEANAGNIDATAPGLTPERLDAVDGEHVTVQIDESTRFYHVGFNIRATPFTNPRFRHAISRMIDRTFLVEDVFDGNARGVLSPLFDWNMVPSNLERATEPPYDFVGDHGSGDVDPDRARDVFREAGYSYNADQELLMQ